MYMVQQAPLPAAGPCTRGPTFPTSLVQQRWTAGAPASTAAMRVVHKSPQAAYYAVSPASVALGTQAACGQLGEAYSAPAALPPTASVPSHAVTASRDQDVSLQELFLNSRLREIPVLKGLPALRAAAAGDSKLTRVQFLDCYQELLRSHSIEVPSEDVRGAIFDLVDRDGNGVVDMMELVCGVALLCGGTEDEKFEAIFNTVDANSDGFISVDELFKFLTSVFRVGLTPQALAVMNSMGPTVGSAEELASVTTMECFSVADISGDGLLSFEEFKNWLYEPGHDPSFLFSPLCWRHLDF